MDRISTPETLMTAKKRFPKYRLHKPRNRAVVTIDGRDIYLGTYESKKSYKRYDRLIAEWLVGGRHLPDDSETATDPNATTVADIAAAYWCMAEDMYQGSGELTCIRHAMRPLVHLYGDLPAAEFSPRKLKAIRNHVIWHGAPDPKKGRPKRRDRPLSRKTVNDYIGRIKRAFAWAAEEEKMPGEVSAALQAVKNLRRGRSAALEPKTVEPIPHEDVWAVLPHVSQQVAAMIQIQFWTGMRAGEVVIMRTGDLDMSDDVWTYVPRQHKTQHLGHIRHVDIGPK
ncbi:MAG: hypothetical protein CL908_13870, partial [Deltaproteobacteria bacterium]|nr:hypothetical protein [Deltaproteobacteria bacterium]